MKLFFANDVAGQSMRVGGATSLAENRIPPHLIQATGRRASAAFQIYIRKNPVLLQALLFGQAPHDSLFKINSLPLSYQKNFIFFFHLL